MLQAILGFQPAAHEGVLYLDPWLPRWLPDITLFDLRIGKWIFDLRIEGAGSDTTITVLRGEAERIRRRPIKEAFEGLLVRPALVE